MHGHRHARARRIDVQLGHAAPLVEREQQPFTGRAAHEQPVDAAGHEKVGVGANAASSSAAPPSRSGVSAAANAPEITVRSIRSGAPWSFASVLGNLADSMTNVGELRRYIADEAAPAFAEFPACCSRRGSPTTAASAGARSTSGIQAEAADQTLPSRARELIGREPYIAETFDLEATVSIASELDRLGLALGG